MFVPVALLCKAQLYLQLQAAGHCIAPHSLPDANNTACVCVVVMTKQWRLWWWRQFCDAEKGRWWIANARDGQSQGEFPDRTLEGGGGLWCVSSFKIGALCFESPVVWLLRWGEGREMVIWCHSYGNVLTVRGLAGQEVRLRLSGL